MVTKMAYEFIFLYPFFDNGCFMNISPKSIPYFSCCIILHKHIQMSFISIRLVPFSYFIYCLLLFSSKVVAEDDY